MNKFCPQSDATTFAFSSIIISRDGRAFLVSRSGVPGVLGTRERKFCTGTRERERIGTLTSRSCVGKAGHNAPSPPPPLHTLNETVDKYLISNYVRFKSSSNELKELALKTATFPVCGVAYKINENHTLDDLNEKYKKMRYFCFLPMPESIERSVRSQIHENAFRE